MKNKRTHTQASARHPQNGIGCVTFTPGVKGQTDTEPGSDLVGTQAAAVVVVCRLEASKVQSLLYHRSWFPHWKNVRRFFSSSPPPLHPSSRDSPSGHVKKTTCNWMDIEVLKAADENPNRWGGRGYSKSTVPPAASRAAFSFSASSLETLARISWGRDSTSFLAWRSQRRENMLRHCNTTRFCREKPTSGCWRRRLYPIKTRALRFQVGREIRVKFPYSVASITIIIIICSYWVVTIKPCGHTHKHWMTTIWIILYPLFRNTSNKNNLHRLSRNEDIFSTFYIFYISRYIYLFLYRCWSCI